MPKAPPDAEGVASLDQESRRGGVFRHKTLWAIAPDAGALRVRGFDLTTGRRIKFAGDHVVGEMRFGAPAGDWSYFAGVTLLPGPGCYAFRVLGNTTRDLIVFEAVLARR